MFDLTNEKYLKDAIFRADAILFLGAGFSSIAKNIYDENLPVGGQLAQKIWNFLGYKSEFRNETLQVMSEALLKSGKNKKEIGEFYANNLLASVIPDEYNYLCKPFWFKIYSSNVDNVVFESYRRSHERKLNVLAYPVNDPVDRDQFLEKIQLVHLNGRLLLNDKNIYDADDLIFSTMQYAHTLKTHLPLYEQFIRECATHPTIYIGTSLEEPLFWEYIAARQDKSRSSHEFRDKSFVISQSISEAKRKFLKDTYNIISIEANTETFLKWLRDISPEIPERIEVLKHTIPNIVEYFKTIGFSLYQKEIQEFAEAFKYVTIPTRELNYRSLYLLGTTPMWEDIFLDFDAPRKITTEIFNSVHEHFTKEKTLNIFSLHGTAGSGKSTILKRVGYHLIKSGIKIYYSESEILPSAQTFFNFLNALKERVVLLFDNAEIILGVLPHVIKEIEKLEFPPIIIIASRTNEFKNLTSRYKSIIELKEFTVPLKLEKVEIAAIIEKLFEKNFPGKLRGMPYQKQMAEFEDRADKQILVAMKEATSGKGFDKIIESEFLKIEPIEAKILSLCIALTSDAGYSVTKESFLGFSKETSGNALDILNIVLQDIVLISGADNNLLSFRHRFIAKYIIEVAASKELLKDAYIRVLDSLSILVVQRSWRDKVSGLYRSLINHRIIYQRFNKDINHVREIYDSVKDELAYEFHFWLQYACLEIEANGGDLGIAENYLDQAESLKSNHPLAITARGHLYLKKAVYAGSKTRAIEFRQKGEEILLKMIETRGYEDPYSYHIYCHQLYNWIHFWVTDDDEKNNELERLITICKKGFSLHPKNAKLDDILDKLQRANYNLGVDINQRPDDPILSFD
jgi:hypothetical protein